MENHIDKENSRAFLNSLNFIEKGGSMNPSLEPTCETSLESESKTPDFERSPEGSLRVSSSQRMKYEAEVALFKKQWGSLEEVRKKIGLSQRKMAQLLMVDPSAWTRWTRPDGEAPPHIYRSLSFFLQLQESSSGSSPYPWLMGVSQPSLPESEVERVKRRLAGELSQQMDGEWSERLGNKLQSGFQSQMKVWKWVMIAQGGLLVILFSICMRLVQK